MDSSTKAHTAHRCIFPLFCLRLKGKMGKNAETLLNLSMAFIQVYIARNPRLLGYFGYFLKKNCHKVGYLIPSLNRLEFGAIEKINSCTA